MVGKYSWICLAIAGKQLPFPLPTIERTEAADEINAADGKVTSLVRKKMDYLAGSKNAGSKSEKTRQVGITELNETQLINFLQA